VKDVEVEVAEKDKEIAVLKGNLELSKQTIPIVMDVSPEYIIENKALQADIDKWIRIAGENQKSANQSAARIEELESKMLTLEPIRLR
jgi:hypothetical protein